MANASRMSSYQRREQLLRIGRSLFAAKGFEAVSVEEIAATAKVSKPIVYEHFGGKEGLYAVVVDREMRALNDTLVAALSAQDVHPRQIVERTALALLTYIEENAEGFQVLVRDSPSTDPIELVLVAAGRCVDARRRDLERMVQEAEAPHERRAVLRTDARGHDGVHRAVLGRPAQSEQGAARRAHCEPSHGTACHA